MSDSNRLLIAAAALSVFFGALIWGVVGVGMLTSDPARRERTHQAESQRNAGSYQSAAEIAERECARGSEEGEDGAGSSLALCAQFAAASAAQNAVTYARVQTLVGLLGFVFVAIGLALNWRATTAATIAAQQTKRSVETLMDTERAWLLFDTAVLKHHLTPASSLIAPHPVADIVIKNVGKSVAWITRTRFRIVNLKRGDFLPGEPDYKEWPFDFETRIEILPGRTFQAETDSVSDWGKKELDALSWTRSRFVIYGLVEYEDAYGRRHETQFARSWHFSRVYGTVEERNAAAHWRAVGLNPYNFQT